jgi:chaperonin GroES
MKIRPLGDRILLKMDEGEEKTQSGLFIPQTAQEKTQTGVVEALGDDEEIKVSTGQKVMYDKYAGTAVSVDGVDYLLVRNDDIIAIVE